MSALFWPYVTRVLGDFSPTPLVALAVFMLGQAVLYVYLPRYLSEPKEYFQRYPDREYLKIDWRRLISKSADILAQQVFVVLLVLSLKDSGFSFWEIILAFGVLFALVHVPLFLREYPAWPAGLFAGAVAAFSVIFPPLILFVPYGFVYNIILHWIFYTVTGSVFWLLYRPTVLQQKAQSPSGLSRANKSPTSAGRGRHS